MPWGAYAMARKTGRYISAATVDEMNTLVCSAGRKEYVLYQPEEQYIASENVCDLISIGDPFLQVYMTSGLAKNFKYKRSINLG